MSEDSVTELLFHLLIQPPLSSVMEGTTAELVHAVGGDWVKLRFPDGSLMSVVVERYSGGIHV